jgi:hypothetical protein
MVVVFFLILFNGGKGKKGKKKKNYKESYLPLLILKEERK